MRVCAQLCTYVRCLWGTQYLTRCTHNYTLKLNGATTQPKATNYKLTLLTHFIRRRIVYVCVCVFVGARVSV